MAGSFNYPAGSPLIKASSTTKIGTSSAGAITFKTIAFAADELQAGDCIEIHTLWSANTPSGTEYFRIGLTDLTDTNAVARSTVGSNLSAARIDRIWIESTTLAKNARFNDAEGVGVSAATFDTEVIDTTTGVNLLFGCTLAAATEIAIEAYTVKVIKAA